MMVGPTVNVDFRKTRFEQLVLNVLICLCQYKKIDATAAKYVLVIGLDRLIS